MPSKYIELQRESREIVKGAEILKHRCQRKFRVEPQENVGFLAVSFYYLPFKVKVLFTFSAKESFLSLFDSATFFFQTSICIINIFHEQSAIFSHLKWLFFFTDKFRPSRELLQIFFFLDSKSIKFFSMWLWVAVQSDCNMMLHQCMPLLSLTTPTEFSKQEKLK